MEIIKLIGAVLFVFAMFWVLGSVGACDCGNITLKQCALQSLVGIIVGWIGLKMGTIGD